MHSHTILCLFLLRLETKASSLTLKQMDQSKLGWYYWTRHPVFCQVSAGDKSSLIVCSCNFQTLLDNAQLVAHNQVCDELHPRNQIIALSGWCRICGVANPIPASRSTRNIVQCSHTYVNVTVPVSSRLPQMKNRVCVHTHVFHVNSSCSVQTCVCINCVYLAFGAHSEHGRPAELAQGGGFLAVSSVRSL